MGGLTMKSALPSQQVLRGLAVSLGLGLVYTLTPLVSADVPAEPDRAKVIGQPTGLIVQPESITLAGPRSLQQLIVTGKHADGTVRDLTPFATAKSETPDIIALEQNLFIRPKKDGATTLVIQGGGQTARIPVTVKDFDKAQPVSFRHDLIASLNVGGCNAGACHGT